jgi:acetyl-CoA carboxylase carboxyl transferase subunit beta
MIGFAGPRVIKETTHQELPAGFQTAEFLLEHGLVDEIVHRTAMRSTLITILGNLVGK